MILRKLLKPILGYLRVNLARSNSLHHHEYFQLLHSPTFVNFLVQYIFVETHESTKR